MFRHAAAAPKTTDHALGRKLEAIEARLDKISSYLFKEDPPPPPASRIRATIASATELIKAHPLAAAGIAFGFGYTVLRIARRR